MPLRKLCPCTLRDVFGFDLPIIGHVEGVGYRRRLLRLCRNILGKFEYRGLHLCCYEHLIDVFFLLDDADAWWCELEIEGRQRHQARCPQFVELPS